MTGTEIKVIIAVLIAIILGLGIKQAVDWRDQAKTAQSAIEQRDKTAGAATGITADLTKSTEGQQRVERTVQVDTAALAAAIEKTRHANPSVDNWLNQPVPDQLRELAKQRREARQRPAAAQPGSPAADKGTPAARADRLR